MEKTQRELKMKKKTRIKKAKVDPLIFINTFYLFPLHVLLSSDRLHVKELLLLEKCLWFLLEKKVNIIGK